MSGRNRRKRRQQRVAIAEWTAFQRALNQAVVMSDEPLVLRFANGSVVEFTRDALTAAW